MAKIISFDSFPNKNNNDKKVGVTEAKTIPLNAESEPIPKGELKTPEQFFFALLGLMNFTDPEVIDKVNEYKKMFPDFELIQKKVDEFKKLEGEYNQKIYEDNSYELNNKELKDLVQLAKELPMEYLQSHPSYATALFVSILTKKDELVDFLKSETVKLREKNKEE